MSRTIRVFWPQSGSGWKNFNWGGVIDQNSVVHISACEGRLDSNSIFGPLNAISRVRGDAQIYVKNIHPHADQGGGGGVEFFLENESAPRDIVTDIIVEDPPEQGAVV